MGTDYTFACARVRGNERSLINKDKMLVMIDAKTMEDACKVLQEAGYGEGEVILPSAYEKALEAETTKLYEFLHSIAPDAEELNIFRYPFDYHNIKTLLKAEFLGISGREILMSGGTVPADTLAVLVKERNYMPLTSHMKAAIEESLDAHARTKDPQSVDLICDKYCYEDISEAVDASGSEFVRGYVRLLIDTINLKTFARARRMNQPWSFFGDVFIPGGNISEKVFIAGYEENLTQFASRLSGYALAEAADGGSTELKENGGFTSLEKLCDDALIRYVKDAKYVSFGIEPILAYAVAKQMEIKSARIILAGKKAGINEGLLRERVRETYG